MHGRPSRKDQYIFVLFDGLVFSVDETRLAAFHPDPLVSEPIARRIGEVGRKRLRREQHDRMVRLDYAELGTAIVARGRLADPNQNPSHRTVDRTN